MWNSLQKFWNKPIVQEYSTTQLDSIPDPNVYYCFNGQFNYTKANEYGYEAMKHFLYGRIVNSTKISWSGMDGNLSFRQLKHGLFKSDFASVEYFSSTMDKINFNPNKNDTTTVFRIPQGFCMKPDKIDDVMYFRTRQKTIVYLEDSSMDTGFRITRSINGAFRIGPVEHQQFQGYNYEMEIDIHDSSIFDGITCTDYERLKSSYGECFEREIQKYFLDGYGCLPPWISGNAPNGMKCGPDINATKIDPKAWQEISRVTEGFELKSTAACLPPCKTMTFKFNELANLIYHKYAFFNLVIKQKVNVMTDVYAYDAFNLIVDLGSALGLWLGFSALSFFDVFLQFTNFTLAKCCKRDRITQDMKFHG